MATQKLHVTYQDGRSLDVLVSPRAMVEVERHYNISFMDDKSRRLEHIYFLGWAAVYYSGKDGRDFDTFLNDVEDVEDVSDPADVKVGPTEPEPSSEESSN